MKIFEFMLHFLSNILHIIVLFGLYMGTMIPILSFGQIDEKGQFFEDGRRHEVGVNVTTVLFSALGNSNNTLDPGRFPWSYKYRLGSGDALRFGLGMNVSFEEQDPNVNFSNFNHFASFRAGYEWRTYLDKRWLAYLGLDAVVDYTIEQVISSTQSDFAVILLSSGGVGGGPVFGLQFALSQRIILGTEASLYAVYRENRRKEQFINNPAFNDTSLTHSLAADLSVPRWLYLSIRL